jgi:hypothetical protein
VNGYGFNFHWWMLTNSSGSCRSRAVGSACVSHAGFGVAPKQSFPGSVVRQSRLYVQEKSAIATRAHQHA